MYFEDVVLGMTASCTKVVTDQDIFTFAELSGDHNPLHLNDEYANATRFKGRVAHGLISGSLFSGILGTQLPGEGTLWVSQTFIFKAPVRPNDTVVATVTVLDTLFKGGRVWLKCVASVGDTVVIEGTAEVSVPKRPVIA